ncbi:hypothetical protein F4604DRAFT_1692804 [Suillus subluteus]|nr:hypothetical protein F4604DRAFT_1692804 [Suillus subluteus]
MKEKTRLTSHQGKVAHASVPASATGVAEIDDAKAATTTRTIAEEKRIMKNTCNASRLPRKVCWQIGARAPSKPPKLVAGELTPEVARDWENACSTYFMHKGIEEKNQVKMVAFGMLDPCLHTWYLAQWVTLDAALKDAWLETHWDTKLRKKVLGSQQGARPFYEWALEIQNQNTLLYGNPTHLDDAQLRSQLEANLCDELTTPVLRAKLALTIMLKKMD